MADLSALTSSPIDPTGFAREFAKRAHATQLYDGQPYMVHVDAVAEIVTASPVAATDDPVDAAFARARRTMIAYLHDVIEDTPVDEQSVEAIFGKRIANCLRVITDPPERPRRERKAIVNGWLSQIAVDSPIADALLVKAADRLANVRHCCVRRHESLLSMYKQEHAAFRVAVYRKGQCDHIWRELDALTDYCP